MSWHEYSRYITVAERKQLAAKKLKALEKEGYKLEPMGKLKSRIKIATSFWGRSWCRHLESFSDYESRLPRGRTYVRNGSILHLGIERGKIKAMVQGSELYELSIEIDPLPAAEWTAVKRACQGKIATLIELLQGKISDEIMTVVTDPANGLFPKPKQIHFNCNCPDWADMCKHIAAVLYGVGARLDDNPELLFTLRGVDQNELISLDITEQTMTSGSRRSRRRTLSAEAVSDVFGIGEEDMVTLEPRLSKKKVKKAVSPKRSKKTEVKKVVKRPAKKRVAKKALIKGGEKVPKRVPPFRPTAASIGKLRKRLGLNKKAFAQAVGASEKTIANWEAKKGKLNLQAKHEEALKGLSYD